MYLKLALRNAKRSIPDYLLYIFTMILLTAILCLVSCIADWGNRAGFQTMALPLLIVLIMAVLSSYIHHFIMRQRAGEFATYMLLGMEKNKLSLVFLCELFMTGLLCFFPGTALGTGIFSVYCRLFLQDTESQTLFRILLKSGFHTFLYFGCMEILTIFFMGWKIYHLEIVQLMKEKQRSQPLDAGKKSFWGRMFIISFFSYLALLCCISFLSDKIMALSISIISLPMLLCIFSFYKWLYAFTASLRLSRADVLYRRNWLYNIAQLTSASKTGANLNSIFCICFLFSAASFVYGTLLLNPDIPVFEQAMQQWMGFLQISICLIFMILYFFILSLMQMIDLKREYKNMRLLFYMGKNQADLKIIILTQILIKLLLPILMAFIILFTAVPFINDKLNALLPVHHYLPAAIGNFTGCFFVLYLCYLGMIYAMSRRHMLIS